MSFNQRSTGYPPAMRRLVNELTKLPSIGEKSASRLAYHLVTSDERLSFSLSDAIREAREKIGLCEVCFTLSENPVCEICGDMTRSRECICVVEKPADVIALERSGHRGLYHVLHGLWSPLKGIGPEKTRIGDLLRRVQAAGSEIKEIIIATSTTVEGDATALYIANAVSELGLSVFRIAQGLPKGGELEYADEITLSHALEGRRRI